MRGRRIIVRTLWSAVVLALVAAGASLWLRAERNRARPVPILMYHKLGVADSKWSVAPDDFEAHLAFLREAGYCSILPRDLAANRRWGKPLPRRPVILTFDDGYLSAMTIAEPLLRKYGFRAVCYLITSLVAERPEERRQYEQADVLTWPEVKQMLERGTVVFGGHTRHHVNLAASSNPYPEIRACLNDIRDATGFRPDAFCYPFGQFRDATVPAVERAHFTTAVTCEDIVDRTGPDLDLYRLPRVSVMGGRHRFAAELVRDAEESAGVGFRLRYQGTPMTVTPRVCAQDSDPEQGWLPPLDLTGRDDTVLRSAADAKRGPDSYRLEIWDRNRVLRLFAASPVG